MTDSMNVSRRNLLKGAALAAGMMAFGSSQLAMAADKAASSTADKAAKTAAAEKGASAAAGAEGEVTLHRIYAAPHGTKSFAQVVVAVDESGAIVAADIDEYQFVDATAEGITPVPNSDSDFAAGYAEGQTLISKKDNDDYYSALMKDHAGATQHYAVSIEAIEEFAAGKKPEELKGVDTVSGATLADTANYLAAIAEAAASKDIVSRGKGDAKGAKFGRVNEAAHGTRSFANAVTLVNGDTVIGTSIDEFQFFDAATEGFTPVPNGDADFAAGFAEGKALGSKAVNDALYSKSLKEKGGATQDWKTSITAIEEEVVGAKLSDKSAEVDTVSGATLEDTKNYVLVALNAGREA